MRIGLVTGEYPPMEGGVGAYTRELGRALAAQGHDVSVFTREAAAGADPGPVHVTTAVGPRWGWRTLGLIRRWALTRRLDVVSVQFQTAAYNMHPAIHWLPSRLREVPVAVTFHDLRFPYLFPKAGRLRTAVVRRLARTAAGAITTNRADERTLRDAWGIQNVAWIPIGSNVSTEPPRGYDRAAWRASLGVEPDDLLISYFGFLNESKGGLVLVEALARLVEAGAPARLVMIGGRAGASDPTNLAYARRVDALAQQHGLESRIHWTGFVDDPVVSAHFLASDLTALPYLDGVSLRRGTLMAALAHGRAIVTTHPETPEAEIEGAVCAVPAGDAAALADAIAVLWRDPAERARLESAARSAAEQFRWDVIAASTTEFFERIT